MTLFTGVWIIVRRIFVKYDFFYLLYTFICSIDTIFVFDSEVFSKTIDRVITIGIDNSGKNPQLVIYVFDTAEDGLRKRH